MPPYLSALAAFCGALVVLGVYHFAAVLPRLRSLEQMLEAHDALLGGGNGGKATVRLDALETTAAMAQRDRDAVQARVEALEKIARAEVPRLGFVRYNAFDDVGSDLSYALAMLNRDGDGVVLSSIYSREDTRTYGKAVAGFQTATDASVEERDAIQKARLAAT